MNATVHPPFDLRKMTALTGQLGHVLAREVECLRKMKIKDIEPLQREKERLLTSLEEMKQQLEANPYLMDECDEDDTEEFREVAEIFEAILLENHRHLLLAREVNARVVGVVRDTLQEEQGSAYYNQVGDGRGKSRQALTMGLNDVV
jgi:flagellar biosynthesis/type III secretory pathway chaperone